MSAHRRRNLQIRKHIVLSPGKDDAGDYLDLVTGSSQADEKKKETKRLRRIFFETYLEESKKQDGIVADLGEAGAKDIVTSTIFERGDSPSDAIETRGKLLYLIHFQILFLVKEGSRCSRFGLIARARSLRGAFVGRSTTT